MNLFQTEWKMEFWPSGAAWHPADDWPAVFELAVWSVSLIDIMYFSQDGAVHASLEPAQILYLTIAYDWFLFG